MIKSMIKSMNLVCSGEVNENELKFTPLNAKHYIVHFLQIVNRIYNWGVCGLSDPISYAKAS